MLLLCVVITALFFLFPRPSSAPGRHRFALQLTAPFVSVLFHFTLPSASFLIVHIVVVVVVLIVSAPKRQTGVGCEVTRTLFYVPAYLPLFFPPAFKRF